MTLVLDTYLQFYFCILEYDYEGIDVFTINFFILPVNYKHFVTLRLYLPEQ